MSKIEAFWENATADDVAKIANTRKSIPARFRDEETEDWVDYLLTGWKLSRHLPGAVWIDADGASWAHCQVYREPSWYADKPEPGQGFRLLDKFPDEELKPGDEYFDQATIKWRCSLNAKAGQPQPEKVWYRRRIEAVEPEPKHYVLRVGDSVETPSGQLVKAVSPGVEQIEFKLRAGFTAKLPNGQTITATEKGYEVTQ
jgi:hypothetical protein